MARVALVRLPYQDLYTVYGRLPRNHELRPPLGLMYVAAALEEDGHEVRIFDGAWERDYADKLILWDPDFVGIGATTPEIGSAQRLAARIKHFCKRTVTILGGPHATALEERAIHSAFDYVVVGEGERAVCSIARYRPSNRVVRRPDIEDLDSLPWPARHLVDYGRYRYPAPGKGLVRTDVVQSIRGCPYQCSFCSMGGTTPRFRDPVQVVEEIIWSHCEHGTEFVMFMDDTLTFKRSHIEGLCYHILRRGLNEKVNFWGLVRADTVDRALLSLMAAAGFTELSMGVETGDQVLGDTVNKNIKLQQYRDAYRWMTELGIQTRGSFIVGLPGETHASVEKTVEFAKSLDLVRASCNILTPYPGTELYGRAKRGEGLRLISEDWSDFKRWGRAVVETDGLTAAELEGSQRRFLAEFYMQPKVLWYHLKQFVRGNRSLYFYRPLFFALKEKMKDWFYESSGNRRFRHPGPLPAPDRAA